MAMPGTTSRTTMPAVAPIAGARMGSAAFATHKQRLCLAVALWNGKDPILKERMFGLSNREGNHGEDVKELYYYLDAVPTYSYARMLYKYPQAAFPYDLLVQENARRDRQSARVRAHRYRHLRRRPLLRRRYRVCQGGRRRHPDAADRHQSRPRRGGDPCAAPALVPQHLELAAGNAQAVPRACRRRCRRHP